MDLPEHSFYDFSNTAWAKMLEENYLIIKDELLGIINNKALDGRGGNWSIPYPEYVSSFNALDKVSWKTYDLLFFGIKQLTHCKKCPKTTELINSIPELVTAQFSLLQPKTKVEKHKGYSRMVLRHHLPLIVPKEGEMGLKVKEETRVWEEGKLLSFNDSFEHEAWNLSQDIRVVLMFDTAHSDCGYNAQEICAHKIDTVEKHSFLIDIAPKKTWEKWLKQGFFS